MTRGPDRFDELRGLLEALCEDTITPNQVARLESLVLADPEAEIHYITYMQMQVDLLREFGAIPPRPDAGCRGRTEGEVGSEVEAADRPAATPDPRPSDRPRMRRPRLPWTIVAAACVALLLIGGFLLGRRLERPAAVAVADRKGPTVGTWRHGPASPPAIGLLALLIKLDGARWDASSDGPAPTEGSVLTARDFACARAGRRSPSSAG